MPRNKKPVILVAVLFGALILLPIIIWSVSKLGGSAEAPGTAPGTVGKASPEAPYVDYDLSQLAEKVDTLLKEDIAGALRKGDLSLDFVADLTRKSERAGSEMRSGKFQRAKEGFLEVVAQAEAQLAAAAAADQARALKDSTYAELQRLDYLRGPFQNTYQEAVESYNKALRSLEAGDYSTAVDDFELAGAILGDMEARSIQQVGTMLEAGESALQKYDLVAAREAFRAVLEVDKSNAAATEGLTMVSAFEGIAEEVKAIRSLEEAGELKAALAKLNSLAADHPNNPFLEEQGQLLKKRILQNDFDALVASSVVAEKADNLELAIADLEAALKLMSDADQEARLVKLQEKYKAVRLEQLLVDGFQALKSARYEAARNIYKEAVALGPNSKEARTGLEKASSLYLANIRYSQNLASAQRYIKEGRFPLAAKLFNEAMNTRPEKISAGKLKTEDEIRSSLDAQSDEVAVVVSSNGRTYVSIIGVLPPERFREKDLSLFPDVYTIRGTRKGYKPVEMEVKVDATQPGITINVECTEKI